MWTTEVTLSTTASKEQIWKLWSEVKSWQQWDKEIEYADLFGDFKAGTKGVLKPLGEPKTDFIVLHTEFLTSFSDRTYLPLCKMDFIHQIKEEAGELKVTHRVEMTGLLSFLFAKIIGKNIAKGLPSAVANLVALAEKNGR